VKDAPRPATVAFRRADAGRSDFSGSEELRAQLQRRLYVAGTLLASTGAVLGGINWLSGATLWNGAPWHPFSPYVQMGYASAVLLALRQLRPGRVLALGRLRVAEFLIFWPLALFTVALMMADYETLRGVLEVAPRDLGMAHSAFWVLGMVAYGALVPNTARRTFITLGSLAVLAFLPDVWAFAEGLLPSSVAPLFLTYKAVFVVGAWVAVSYGSYRYEAVVRREAAARELGQYVLGDRIGAGGMGEVFLGEHRMLRRPVAIKLITPAQAGSPEAIARFEREAQATAQLTHPNTVQVFDYGRAEDGTFYCVMEYLPGRTLEQLVREDGPMEPGRVIAVLTQVCGALAEAHAAGLVHRDIKPSNVMLTVRGGIDDVAKLLDFGLVVSRMPGPDGRLTETGSFVGTPEFMSPEQCAGIDAEIGPASDIYSLAAVGYFLVVGRSPFAGRSATQMLAAHLYEDPAPLTGRPGVPAALDAAIRRGLAKDPSGRFASAAEFAAALAGLAEDSSKR